MVIVSYDVEERLHRTVAAFKDIFLIIFFISFGMLLDPKQIPGILWMILIVVPVTILGEIVITSSSAFFSGFTSRSSISIGTSMIARGEYSLIFASMGFATGAISESLYQFTGVYVFIMTLIAPIAMKNSEKIKHVISFGVPRFLKYGAKLVSITMRPILLPEEADLREERGYKFLVLSAMYMVIMVLSFIMDSLYLLIALAVAGLAVIFFLRKLFIIKIKKLEAQIDFGRMHQGPYSMHDISTFIANVFTGFLSIVLLGASFWNFGYIILLVLSVLFAVYLSVVSLVVYKKSLSLQ